MWRQNPGFFSPVCPTGTCATRPLSSRYLRHSPVCPARTGAARPSVQLVPARPSVRPTVPVCNHDRGAGGGPTGRPARVLFPFRLESGEPARGALARDHQRRRSSSGHVGGYGRDSEIGATALMVAVSSVHVQMSARGPRGLAEFGDKIGLNKIK